MHGAVRCDQGKSITCTRDAELRGRSPGVVLVKKDSIIEEASTVTCSAIASDGRVPTQRSGLDRI
jgi:hypothetical protein